MQHKDSDTVGDATSWQEKFNELVDVFEDDGVHEFGLVYSGQDDDSNNTNGEDLAQLAGEFRTALVSAASAVLEAI